MAKSQRGFLIDGVLSQTVNNCRAVLAFMSKAQFDDGTSDEVEYGRYLIIQDVRAALASVEEALESTPRRLEAVHG